MIATDTTSAIGALFADVQAQHVFKDQKTFADAEPLYALPYIAAKYANQKNLPGFDLLAFVRENFLFPPVPKLTPLPVPARYAIISIISGTA
ncbi:hypothetical protein LWM68_34480 [Niabella sp. W65]|nr:hypothetical protein [Niabella sp. W65]MCH7367420.1 hypothetical protein [Niabella sp. W65]ULT43622.1 hypothetical protein KRR40_09485 [Niabella sp. I65]